MCPQNKEAMTGERFYLHQPRIEFNSVPFHRLQQTAAESTNNLLWQQKSESDIYPGQSIHIVSYLFWGTNFNLHIHNCVMHKVQKCILQDCNFRALVLGQVGRSAVDRASSSDARGLGFEPHLKKYHFFTQNQVALWS